MNYTNNITDEEKRMFESMLKKKMLEFYENISKDMLKTIIHKISISNGDIIPVADAEVPGYVLNQFSMDEYNGYFRIATTTPSWFFP